MLSNRACPHEIDDTEFTVKNLIEGKPYEFRVAAVNEAGVGEFAECEKPIVPKAPASELIIFGDVLPFKPTFYFFKLFHCFQGLD